MPYTVGMEAHVTEDTASKIAAVAGLALVTTGRDTSEGHKTVEEICPFGSGVVIYHPVEDLLPHAIDGFTVQRLLGEAIRDDARRVGAEQIANIRLECDIVGGLMWVQMAADLDVNPEPLAVLVSGGKLADGQAEKIVQDARTVQLPYVTTVDGLTVEVRALAQDDPTPEEMEEMCRLIDAEIAAGVEPDCVGWGEVSVSEE